MLLLVLLSCRSALPDGPPSEAAREPSIVREVGTARAVEVELTPQMLYERARRLERWDRYAEAVAVYDRLETVAPGFRDTAARCSTLIELIELAEELYAEALRAETAEETRAGLELIRLFWPGYRDVSERLATSAANDRP